MPGISTWSRWRSEFLKAANVRKWLEGLVLRHVDRVRQIGEDLRVLAEIEEVDV